MKIYPQGALWVCVLPSIAGLNGIYAPTMSHHETPSHIFTQAPIHTHELQKQSCSLILILRVSFPDTSRLSFDKSHLAASPIFVPFSLTNSLEIVLIYCKLALKALFH